MCVHVGTTIEVNNLTILEDSLPKLTFIKNCTDVCIRFDHRPKIMKSLANKCMKCYQNISNSGSNNDGQSDMANIKVVVAAAKACLELLRLFNDRKLMDTLLTIVVNNLSSA